MAHVYISFSSYNDFFDRVLLLTRKILNHGFLVVKLKSSLRKFYGCHHDMVNDHEYVPFDVITIQSCSHSWHITELVTRVKPACIVYSSRLLSGFFSRLSIARYFVCYVQYFLDHCFPWLLFCSTSCCVSLFDVRSLITPMVFSSFLALGFNFDFVWMYQAILNSQQM